MLTNTIAAQIKLDSSTQYYPDTKFALSNGQKPMNQRKYLETAQKQLHVGPVEMARLLDTSFNTYKAWLYEKNPLPGAAKAAIDCMLSNPKYTTGAKFAKALNAAVAAKRPD